MELTETMVNSLLLSLELQKKQEEKIKTLFEAIELLQKMSNNQEKRILILRDLVQSQDQKIDLLKKMIENK